MPKSKSNRDVRKINTRRNSKRIPSAGGGVTKVIRICLDRVDNGSVVSKPTNKKTGYANPTGGKYFAARLICPKEVRIQLERCGLLSSQRKPTKTAKRSSKRRNEKY